MTVSRYRAKGRFYIYDSIYAEYTVADALPLNMTLLDHVYILGREPREVLTNRFQILDGHVRLATESIDVLRRFVADAGETWDMRVLQDLVKKPVGQYVVTKSKRGTVKLVNVTLEWRIRNRLPAKNRFTWAAR
jgi:hypothetical protein